MEVDLADILLDTLEEACPALVVEHQTQSASPQVVPQTLVVVRRVEAQTRAVVDAFHASADSLQELVVAVETQPAGASVATPAVAVLAVVVAVVGDRNFVVALTEVATAAGKVVGSGVVAV